MNIGPIKPLFYVDLNTSHIGQVYMVDLTFVSFISYSLPIDDFSPKGELIILRIQNHCNELLYVYPQI